MKRNLTAGILLLVLGLGVGAIGFKTWSSILYSRSLGKIETDIKSNSNRLKAIGAELESMNERLERVRVAIQPIIMRGVASWYGTPFHGRITASGERYDMHGYTLAHRSLPFGTYVKVRNVDTDIEAIGIVTDRGPFIEGRDFDLSLALARKLDFELLGLQMIEVEILEIGQWRYKRR